ncbi:MAG TPA: DNA polymerase III subunit alpha [bacterium]|nr:DNA polymerase III subunit alpha [bacterium]
MSFVHLHVHSHYSFMRGIPDPETLCRAARRAGMKQVALTDRNGLYGLIFFLQAARETGIRPILGAEVETASERAVCLAKTADGYANLCRILTERHLNRDFSLFQALRQFGGGLAVLTDSIRMLQGLGRSVDGYAELRAGYPFRSVLEAARSADIPAAATTGASFLLPGDYDFHRLMRAVDLNTKLSRLPPSACESPSAWLMPPDRIRSHFPHIPEAVENTARIAGSCDFSGGFGSVISPGFEDLDNGGLMDRLRERVREGAIRRYGSLTLPVRRRIEYELEIIGEKGFGAVFLVMEDIVNQAPRTCGRGSAAASLVSYCLGITHVDPLKYNLYFERFLNPGRKDPPDIDVDFPWDERDEILDYVFKKYGEERTAMVSNHVGFRPRAAVREVARVYGLPEAEIKAVTDRLARLWYWTGEDVETMMKTHPVFRGMKLGDPWPEILALSSRLRNQFRHLSVHCGGVVITPRVLSNHVPVEKAPKGVRIIQWEKDQTEDSGLVKIDLLGNRSLAVIRDALAAIRRHTGRIIDYADFNPLDDEDTKDLIARGDTLGVFYIESPAMRQLQKKTGRGDFEHLVIHSSIIRPAANTYINEYVRRLKGEPYEPIHPILQRVLGETYGIMVYQEDVTKIAVEMAGFTPGEGDGLRKTLSKKRNHRRLTEYSRRFRAGARARGIGSRVIDQVWEMILSFGGYSFCKPHSASYAMVSFKSAYLRAHYPAEFMAAVISNQGGYYTTFAYLSEARRMGLKVLPPDINASDRHYRGRSGELRVGLMQLKGLRGEALDVILSKREQGGPYDSFESFIRRTGLEPADLRILIKAGCFDSVAQERTRPQLLWETEAVRRNRPRPQTTLDLFSQETLRIPDLGSYDFHAMLRFEVEVLGFPLCAHPLDLYEETLRRVPRIHAADMHRHVGKRVTLVGWWVTNKMVYTRQEEPMAFISFEDRTALFETIFFPPAFRRYASRFSPVRPVILRGKVENDLGAVSLHVESMQAVVKAGQSS